MIRVFLVDDSAFVRRALTRVLAVEPEFRVVGEAASGSEALARIPAADPDLVTLDVAMPGMDGLELLPALLRWKPSLKVLMISAHTRDGADATVAALAAGAVDFIDKTTFNVMDLEYLRREVVDRMKARGAGPPGRPASRTTSAAARAPVPDAPDLTRVRAVRHRRLDRRPAAVQQHPAGAAGELPACRWSSCSTCRSGSPGRSPQRLASLSRVRVAEAEDGVRLVPGMALIAPAGQHLRVSPNLAVVLTPEPSDAKHIPSVDVTMRSAARSRPGKVLGHPAHRHGRGRGRRDGDHPRGRRRDHRGERVELRGLRHAARGGPAGRRRLGALAGRRSPTCWRAPAGDRGQPRRRRRPRSSAGSRDRRPRSARR